MPVANVMINSEKPKQYDKKLIPTGEISEEISEATLRG